MSEASAFFKRSLYGKMSVTSTYIEQQLESGAT